MFGSIDPLYSLTGFFVGLLVGQTGMGGGAMMTPLLILLFGVHPATASGLICCTRRRRKPLVLWCMASITLCDGAS